MTGRFFVVSVVGLLVTANGAAAQDCIPTAADSLGPFYVAGTPVVENLNRQGWPGEPLKVTGRILSAAPDHAPLADARVEVWQTDGAGDYHPQGSGNAADYAEAQVDLRGTMVTDAAGIYRFDTVVPGGYFPRPRHFHYRITAPGHATLVTQLYITGDGTLGQPGEPCRHAPLETAATGQTYTAPDIFLVPQ